MNKGLIQNTNFKQGGSEWCEISTIPETFQNRKIPGGQFSGIPMDSTHFNRTYRTRLDSRCLDGFPFSGHQPTDPSTSIPGMKSGTIRVIPTYFISSIETGCPRIKILTGFDDQGWHNGSVLSPIIKKEVSLVENFQPVIQNQPPTQRKIGEYYRVTPEKLISYWWSHKYIRFYLVLSARFCILSA
jgi:hypothetical protein